MALAPYGLVLTGLRALGPVLLQVPKLLPLPTLS
jgi:hypothetical protein